jgi:hypothetical protein
MVPKSVIGDNEAILTRNCAEPQIQEELPMPYIESQSENVGNALKSEDAHEALLNEAQDSFRKPPGAAPMAAPGATAEPVDVQNPSTGLPQVEIIGADSLPLKR